VGGKTTPARSDEGRVGQTGRTEFDNEAGHLILYTCSQMTCKTKLIGGNTYEKMLCSINHW